MKRFLLDTSAILTLRSEQGAVLLHKDPEFKPLPIEQEFLPLKL